MVVNKQKLYIVMANNCITSGELQKKSNLPRGTFLNVITGKNVRPATVGKIAKALDVPVESLINMEGGD
jgi:predicted transcriptional regulator